MIEKVEQFEDRSEYRVNCDGCSFYQDFEAFGFDDLIKQIRKSGWLSIKQEDGEWEHFCFECKEYLVI